MKWIKTFAMLSKKFISVTTRCTFENVPMSYACKLYISEKTSTLSFSTLFYRLQLMGLHITGAASNALTEDVWLALQITLLMREGCTASTTTFNWLRRRGTTANLKPTKRRAMGHQPVQENRCHRSRRQMQLSYFTSCMLLHPFRNSDSLKF